MLLNIDVSQAMDFLGFPKMIREDRVIPGHFRPSSESPYGQGFDWLYRYEHALSDYLIPLLTDQPTDLIGENSLLHEALSNAFCHAHQRNPLKPITVGIMLGDQGLIIRVADCGKGFNVQKMHKHYRIKRRFFTSVGNGIRLMAASNRYGVFYNIEGTAFYLLYPFEKNLTDLSPDHMVAPVESLVEDAA